MSPIYAFARFDQPRYRRGKIIRLPIYLVNDTDREVAAARVEIQVTDPVGNSALAEAATVSLPADCEARAVMNPELLLQWEGRYRLEIKLSAGEQKLENVYRFQVS
jgi:hypothetical protein